MRFKYCRQVHLARGGDPCRSTPHRSTKGDKAAKQTMHDLFLLRTQILVFLFADVHVWCVSVWTPKSPPSAMATILVFCQGGRIITDLVVEHNQKLSSSPYFLFPYFSLSLSLIAPPLAAMFCMSLNDLLDICFHIRPHIRRLP